MGYIKYSEKYTNRKEDVLYQNNALFLWDFGRAGAEISIRCFDDSTDPVRFFSLLPQAGWVGAASSGS